MADHDARNAVTTPAAITSVCSRCGATMPTASTICAQCGAAMGATSGATGGQRATVPSGSAAGQTSGADQAERIRARLQEQIGDQFQLLELLGRGGMGIVFRAKELALDREVALKVLALDPLLNPDAFGRFEREAKLAARLDHPHIVPIFTVGQRDSIAYYTMRLVRGGSVEDLLTRGRPLPFDRVLGILRDVATALDYAHGHGVVHRDIKPANILLGETGHAMVADFGIAKAFGATGSGGGMTGTGIIGSPGYMPPEQWRGEDLDGRADQYALGIVAFEMLTGKRPFETPNIQDLLKLHLAAAVPSARTFREGISDASDAAIQRALSKEPGHRFSSSTAFVEALSGLRPVVLPGGRTAAGPKFEPKRAPAPPKRGHKKLIVFVMLAAMVGGAFAAPQTRPLAMRYVQLGKQRGERLADDTRRYVDLVKSDLAGGPAYDTIRPTDSIALAAGESLGLEMTPDPEPLEPTGTTQIERRPIGFDTTLLAGAALPRPTRTATDAFVRVVLRGGAAPIIVDGRELEVSADPRGRVIRVEPGTRYIWVRGAGVLFVPSQVKLTLAPNDTGIAVFSVPNEQSTAAPATEAVPPSSTPPPPPQQIPSPGQPTP